jgi:pseudaminic acid biosynthesis-associated methylase
MNLWATEFGNDYTRRNSNSDIQGRSDIWQVLLPRDTASILEVGANLGHNLEAISQFSQADLCAVEPNQMAREGLYDTLDWVSRRNIREDYADKLSFETSEIDLVFTCGVLIHIGPDKLLASMKEIHRVAKRYIICGEYFSPREEMVPYRGHEDALWKRDYGSLWLDNFNDLHCIGTLFAWKRITAFDNLTFWVFEKGPWRN